MEKGADVHHLKSEMNWEEQNATLMHQALCYSRHYDVEDATDVRRTVRMLLQHNLSLNAVEGGNIYNYSSLLLSIAKQPVYDGCFYPEQRASNTIIRVIIQEGACLTLAGNETERRRLAFWDDSNDLRLHNVEVTAPFLNLNLKVCVTYIVSELYYKIVN